MMFNTKLFKYLVFFTFLNLVFTPITQGQTSEIQPVKQGLRKNIIYGTIGASPSVYAVIQGNYERIVIQTEKGFFKNYLVRAGGGSWASWTGSGPHGVITFTGLTGKKNSHIEVSIGMVTFYDGASYDIGVSNSYRDGVSIYPEPTKSEYLDFYPAGGIGYRFQQPGGNFVFRVGLSIPEAIYISLGFAI